MHPYSAVSHRCSIWRTPKPVPRPMPSTRRPVATALSAPACVQPLELRHAASRDRYRFSVEGVRSLV